MLPRSLMARLLIVEDNPELAALIASAAKSRGHVSELVYSGAGAVDAAVRTRPDLAIVDLLLPDVNGKDVLLQLKEKAIPTVAISGVYKGDAFAQEAVRDLGARAFFEKPFEMRALLDAVDQIAGIPEGLIVEEDGEEGDEEGDDELLEELEVLDPVLDDDEARAPDEPLVPEADGPPAMAFNDDLDDVPTTIRQIDPAILAKAAGAPPPPAEAASAEDELAAMAAEVDDPITVIERAPESAAPAASTVTVDPVTRPVALAPELPGEPDTAVAPPPAELLAEHRETAAAAPEWLAAPTAPAPPPPPEPLAAQPHPPGDAGPPQDLPLPFASRESVWNQAPAKPSAAKAPQSSQTGDLSQTSVPRLLTAYYQARHSGELKLKQGAVVKVVAFEDGFPVYAASNVSAERFGRFCVRKGALSDDQLAQVAAKVQGESLRTGEAMLALGLLDEARRAALLEEQVREIIWSTFGWKTGQYSFSPKRSGRTDLVKLKVFPGNLILEGVQRTEPLVTLRQKMPATRRLYPTPDPAYALNELKLSGPQAILIAYADGTKTVEDLLTLSDIPEKDALATLLGLELLGVLQERKDENKRRRITFGL